MDYLTLAGPCESITKEKMSKFIAFAAPVDDVEQAKEFINGIAKKYHDARHVCWAYMLGADRATYLSSDNGEPSGTAGKPILGQINSLGLTDVAVAVVRYFGGIKLGTSGLIVAYREAARAALEAGEIVKRSEMCNLEFYFPYLAMNDVMKLIKNSSAEIVSQMFDNNCNITLRCPLSDVEELQRRLSDIDGTSFPDTPITPTR